MTAEIRMWSHEPSIISVEEYEQLQKEVTNKILFGDAGDAWYIQGWERELKLVAKNFKLNFNGKIH